MRKPSRGFHAFVLVTCFLVLASLGWAQTGGTLAGKVVDAAEKFGLPTVQIGIAGTRIFGATDAEGNFAIRNIPEGIYRVVFDLPGYIKFTEKDITITAGQTTEITIEMKMGFAHEATVTARRAVVKLQEVPQNVEVLTSEEIAETPISNMHRALDNITGVDVTPSNGGIQAGSWVSINGYGSDYVKQMVDGVEVSGVLESWTLSNSYSDMMVDQVEVIKGGSTSAWGSNMGGIINFVTKRPRNMERPQFSLKGMVGTWGEMDSDGNALPNPGGGGLRDFTFSGMGNVDKLGYLFGIRYYRHDGFNDYGEEKLNSVYAKLSYEFNDRTYLDVFYNYNGLKTQFHYFLALAPGFYFWNDKSDSDMNTQVGYTKLTTQLTSAWNLEATLKYYTTDYEGAWEYLVEGFAFDSTFNERRLGATVTAHYRPSLEFNMVVGGDYYRIKADIWNSLDFTDIETQYIDQYAPFFNAEYRIGPLALHAGVRYDYDSSINESQWSPTFGANFNLGKATLIRANVGRTFKIPPILYRIIETYSAGYLPNPDLKAERAWAYSAGFESQELDFLWVKFSVYYHDMTNGIIAAPITEGPNTGRAQWDNVSKFIRKGYEAEVGLIAPFGLQVYAGTNFNDHSEKTDEGEEVLIWIPTRTYKSGIKYRNDKLDILANLRGRWMFWNMDDDFLQMLFAPKDKIWVFDLRVSKGFRIAGNTHLSIFLDVYNLFDKLYWERRDIPPPRRWGQLGFNISFN